MQWFAVVQAVTSARFGPLNPNMIDSCPAIMLMMLPGTKNGEILRGPPFVRSSSCVSSISGSPPIPEPITQPIRSRSIDSRSSPGIRIAWIAAAMP